MTIVKTAIKAFNKINLIILVTHPFHPERAVKMDTDRSRECCGPIWRNLLFLKKNVETLGKKRAPTSQYPNIPVSQTTYSY
jgi:hypothetical protein